jgi:hypothetical protein
MSEKSSENTPAPSAGPASASLSSLSAPPEHWLPRTAGILCATALVLPTALSLPELFKLPGSDWEAVTFVAAVGTPLAVDRIIRLIQAFRGGSK